MELGVQARDRDVLLDPGEVLHRAHVDLDRRDLHGPAVGRGERDRRGRDDERRRHADACRPQRPSPPPSLEAQQDQPGDQDDEERHAPSAGHRRQPDRGSVHLRHAELAPSESPEGERPRPTQTVHSAASPIVEITGRSSRHMAGASALKVATRSRHQHERHEPHLAGAGIQQSTAPK
jgi:hypothetical protein